MVKTREVELSALAALQRLVVSFLTCDQVAICVPFTLVLIVREHFVSFGANLRLSKHVLVMVRLVLGRLGIESFWFEHYSL